MPELPEVETVRRDLESTVVGRTIHRVEATGRRTVRRTSAEALAASCTGCEIVGTGRHGKWLWLDLAPAARVYVHLRMSGQLLLAPAAEPLAKHTHAVFHLGSDQLRFVDPRTFGEVIGVNGTVQLDDLSRHGPDALNVPASAWAPMLATRRALKTVLTDQRSVAGIGNIYADEIAHRAGVRPQRAAASLTGPARRRIAAAVEAVLGDAIEARGSSLSDEQYVDLTGHPGRFQRQHRVHACPACGSCGGPVTRLVLAGRGTYFCRTCQH